MASRAQIHANRSNAQKSTGPRTTEGKEKVSQNAVTHGLTGRRDVIRGEDPEEFALHRAQMLEELAPVGAMEAMLAMRVVSLSWRLRRAERLQNDVFDLLYLKEATSSYSDAVKLGKEMGPDGYYSALGPVEEDLVAGWIIMRDFSNGRAFERLLMYERRIEQSLYRAMAELRKLRLARQLGAPAAGPARQAALSDGEDRLRKTNPICERRDAGRGLHLEPAACCAKQTQFPQPEPAPSACSAGGDGVLCETKPICRADSGLAGTS
jgi:hypothetical protein